MAGTCDCGKEPSGSIKMRRNFLTIWKLVSFSRRTLLHGVSKHSFLLRESYETKKYNILAKVIDITAGSPHSRHWLQVLKTAIRYVPTEHRYHTLPFRCLLWRTHHDYRDRCPFVRLAHTQASNLPYSVQNWIVTVNLDHCSINHHARAVSNVL